MNQCEGANLLDILLDLNAPLASAHHKQEAINGLDKMDYGIPLLPQRRAVIEIAARREVQTYSHRQGKRPHRLWEGVPAAKNTKLMHNFDKLPAQHLVPSMPLP